MKVELILEIDTSYTLEQVLEAYDDIKYRLTEQNDDEDYFEIKKARIILDKPVKEIELSKY